MYEPICLRLYLNDFARLTKSPKDDHLSSTSPSLLADVPSYVAPLLKPIKQETLESKKTRFHIERSLKGESNCRKVFPFSILFV